MKKLLSLLLVLGLALVLVGCGSVSQNYADKVNKKAEDEKYLTYDQVMKDLGKNPISDLTAEGFGVGRSGAVTWAKGCKSADDYDKKLDAGKTVKTITVTFLNGKATAASYNEAKKDK